MNIRTRLTAIFSVIVIIILIGVTISIYFFSADYREEDYYHRLKSKATNTAQLLIDVEEIDAELLMKMEQRDPTNLANERTVILNYKNEILYSTDIDKIITLDSSRLSEIRLGNELRFRINEYEAIGFLFTAKYDRFTVLTAATDIYGFRKLSNLRDILLIVWLLSIIIVPLSGWFYAGRALSPISKLVNQTDAISADQLNRRLHLSNKTDEIGKLAQTFNRMLDRLENAFLAQKHFIANASHELRTPLTSITGEIQVTLIQPRSAEKYQHALESVLEEVKALSLLSNQLLILAQASSEISRNKMSSIRLDELLWQVKDEIERSNSLYKVEIELDAGLDDELLTVRGDEQLLKTAISNLMDNGCKYSDNNTVVVRLFSEKGKIKCEFKNHGIGIEAADLSSIFQPFFRGSSTRHIRGHGIGLSLASKIIELHEGQIQVTSIPGNTTSFSILLPLAKEMHF